MNTNLTCLKNITNSIIYYNKHQNQSNSQNTAYPRFKYIYNLFVAHFGCIINIMICAFVSKNLDEFFYHQYQLQKNIFLTTIIYTYFL